MVELAQLNIYATLNVDQDLWVWRNFYTAFEIKERCRELLEGDPTFQKTSKESHLYIHI